MDRTLQRREGVDALGLPIASSSSSRSRPGTSHAARSGPYTLGTTFANSSSSLVNLRNHTASDTNLVPSAVPASDAPHLSAAEVFFGRMTLTAPDNMRRRKAEEKEKRKQARRKKSERGAAAAATLLGQAPEAGSGSNVTALTTTAAPLSAVFQPSTTSSSSSNRRRRPPLPTSNSTSNLHTYPLEQSRSRSPARPVRPHSSHTNRSTDPLTSPERRARRTNSGSSALESAGTVELDRPAAPVYQRAQSVDQGRQRQVETPDNSETNFSSAAQQRRDIYADLETLNLPGANESDLEDQPPAFPEYATRPISPPRQPAEGEEWTEEMRRRQEEYEMNRPPDSPPPAFQSEDESRRDAQDDLASSSEEEGETSTEEIRRTRLEWDEDIAAGFSLNERVERDRIRREMREPRYLEASATSTPTATPDTQIEAVERNVPESQTQEIQALPPADLGRLVIEARARRALATEPEASEESNAAQAQQATSSQSNANSPVVVDATSETTAGSAASKVVIPPVQTNAHRRVASDGTLLPASSAARERQILRANKKAAAHNLSAAQQSRKVLRNGRALNTAKSRSRPVGESHSRFRDGASAAAARRMALWGPYSSLVKVDGQAEGVDRRSLIAPQTVSDGDLPTPKQLSMASAPNLGNDAMQWQSPPMSLSNSVVNVGSGSSSDSDDKWDKEEAAFEAMQRKLAPPPRDIDSSDDEAPGEGHEPLLPGHYRSNLMDLYRPEASVPRAPPPLALGRSRGGGAEYSSSSSSDDSDSGRRVDDSDDDSLSPTEAEMMTSEGTASFALPARPIDKGKQPERPTLKKSEPDTSVSSMPSTAFLPPAGEFEEDSGSSRDFVSSDDDAELNQVQVSRRQSTESSRPLVSNRLKGLFSTHLPSAQQQTTQAASSASRASFEGLFDTQLNVPERSRRPSASVRKPSLTYSATSIEDGEHRIYRQSSSQSLRARERANAYAALEVRRGLTQEEQARSEALEQISRLQRAGPSSSQVNGFNQDSLDALERLLTKNSPLLSQARPEQAEGTWSTPLTRSGALNRHWTPSPFVNPRSSVAPRPLGRLPTITNATRHFPPSCHSTITSSEAASDSSVPGSATPYTAYTRRSRIGTPSWMAYIPANERNALPDPLEPVKKRADGLSTMGNAERQQRPALPPRPVGNRVSAMVERFENQSLDSPVPPISPRSPGKESFSGPPATLSPAEESSGWASATTFRRPPPTPPASGQRQNPFQSTAGPGEEIASGNAGAEARPVFQEAIPVSSLSSVDLSSATHIAEEGASTHDLRASSGTSRSSLTPAEHPTSTTEASVQPRPRYRPLPIPPIPVAQSTLHQSDQPYEVSSEQIEQLGMMSPASADPPATLRLASPQAISEESSTTVPGHITAPREASLGYTDLDLFASRLAEQGPSDSANYDDLHLLAEILGPAKQTGATAEEIETLNVGRVEVLRKRVVGKRENGKDKVKLVLNVMGVKVERCAVCLVQFKEGNMACVFPCMHVLHEECASKLLRRTKLCPSCRTSVV